MLSAGAAAHESLEARSLKGSADALSLLTVAVVIPCYRVKRHILDVLAAIGPDVAHIFVVDDACPERSGQHVVENCRDPRVKVLFHAHNRGVGGAMKTGYREALRTSAAIVVKLDGDGQMDPAFIPRLVRGIRAGHVDYCKGNRFYNRQALKQMPLVRTVGNALLSFASKASSGYWQIMDPTNGYTAIHAAALRAINIDDLSDGFFFESDMLFRLHLLRAVVRDVDMPARYADQVSNLSLRRSIVEFPLLNLSRFFKRLGYDYFVQDFNLGSVELIAGVLLFSFGLIFGLVHWMRGMVTGVPTQTGTIFFSAVPMILGFQLLLSFVNHDVVQRRTEPVQRRHLE